MCTTTFDLDERPGPYWDHPCLAWSQTAGTIRRLALMLEHKEGLPSELPDEMRGTHLSSDLLDGMGRYNPRQRSGEDLPEYAEGEVEIARLWYPETVHGEVISIRARRRGRWIRYRIAHEFADIRFRCQPVRTELPLTLGELVRLIDTAKDVGEGGGSGLYFGDLEWRIENGDCSADDLATFILVDSPFYPDLAGWYREALRRWTRLVECGWGPQKDSLRLMAGLYDTGTRKQARG